MSNNIKKVVIIGGGPAGMMAAIRASQLVKNVILVEKNTVLGEKLLLSGNGRCNLTNSEPLESFLKGYIGNGNFLRDACKVFFNNDLIQFFESRKLPLITEHDGKIFPKTNSASSVRDVITYYDYSKKRIFRHLPNVISPKNSVITPQARCNRLQVICLNSTIRYLTVVPRF